MIAVLLALVVVEFTLSKATPVDPARLLLGTEATEATYEAAQRRLGLDEPWPVQLYNYILNLLQGDLGISARTGEDVTDVIIGMLPATLELCAVAVVFALLGGMLLAWSSAAKWPGAGVVRAVYMAGASAPAFLVSLLAIMFLANELGWFPSGGRTSFPDAPSGPTGFLLIDTLVAGEPAMFWDALHHLILPALCISIPPAMAVGRVLRGSLLDNINSPHCRTALAKGLTGGQVLRRHVLRNSMGPTLSMSGLQLGVIFAVTIVVEMVFGWPGVGAFLAQSIPANDFTVIAAITLLLGFAYVVANTAVDIAQAIADPRIRL